MTAAEARATLRCSFCTKSPPAVDRLVEGPGVYICNECIDLCQEIILEEYRPGEGWDPPADDPDALLADLRRAAENLRPIEHRIQQTVTQLRGLGVTWAKIGECLGISRQAAWQRFSVPEGPDA